MRFGSRAAAELIAVFLLLWCLTAATQYAGGAWTAELGGDESDEPAHYVTGLMVRDYIAQGAPARPMAFAQEYYRHYPKVGLGHWPPVFYLVQSAWTLPFGVSRASLLLLMAALTALVGLLLFREARIHFGAAPALGAALLMLALPQLQIFTRAVMAEMLVALFVWLSIQAYARFLDRGSWRDAVWFGLWSSAAILTKGTGFALALVPLFALLLTRRWELLKQPAFWLPLAIVLVLCGPWYAFAPDARHERVAPYGELKYGPWSLRRTPLQWAGLLGWLAAALFAIGFFERFWTLFRRRPLPAFWVPAISLMCGLTLFRLFVGAARNQRTLTLALPLALLFALHSATWLAARLPGRAVRAGAPLLLLVLSALNLNQVEPKPSRGFIPVVHHLLADPSAQKATVLVCSDPFGEGMFIAEMAMHERRPGHVIERGNKALAEVGWMSKGYALKYRTPEEVGAYLSGAGIGLIVVDDGGSSRMPHRDLLARYLNSTSDWVPGESSGSVRVYRRASTRE